MKRHYFVFLALILATLGCNFADRSSGGQNNASASNASANSTSNSAKKSADANREVASAFENLKTQPSVIAKVDNEGAGTKYDELIEAVGIGKARRVFVYAPGFQRTPSDSSEEVQIGKDVFEKRADGDWVRVGYSTTDSTVFDNMILRPLSAADFASSGEETIDGKAASVYTLTVTSPEAPKGITGKVWIRKDKQVPLKARIDRPDGSSTTYTYDLDTPVKPIETPKVKDTSR